MTNPTLRLRTVAFLARKPGLEILNVLLRHPRVELCAVFTHTYVPQAEWIQASNNVRPETPIMAQWCAAANIPFDPGSGDGEFLKSTAKPPKRSDSEPGRLYAIIQQAASIDLLICCNWRSLVGQNLLDATRYAINIHRGDLPKYPGARPIKQAIDAGEKYVALTAHHMIAEYDAGPVIAKIYSPILYSPVIEDGRQALDVEKNTRDSLEPLYAPLTRMVLETLP